MDLMSLATAATNIAAWAVNKTTGGALSKAGGEILVFLKDKLAGKLDFNKVPEEKKLLEAAILSKAHLDEEFKYSLEKLVLNYQSIDSSSDNNVSQTSDSGANVNVGSNSGTVIGQQNNIGQQGNNTFFR